PHPYTRGLLKSLPSITRGINEAAAPRKEAEAASEFNPPTNRLPTIKGMVPPINALPQGCKFNPRCPDVMDICLFNEPALMPVGPSQAARCYLHGDLADPERKQL